MYPGGLKETPYQTMMEKKPDHVRTSDGQQILCLTRSSIGHSTRRVWNVAKEQAERSPFGTSQNISIVPNGKIRREYSKNLGRWQSTARFRSFQANYCTDAAETQGRGAEDSLTPQNLFSLDHTFVVLSFDHAYNVLFR